jgi:threonine dehydrogenase-like Zn-dependent dehydrogenase
VLVKAKYASVCGSDMPYFKARSLMAPSSYWVSAEI